MSYLIKTYGSLAGKHAAAASQTEGCYTNVNTNPNEGFPLMFSWCGAKEKRLTTDRKRPQPPAATPCMRRNTSAYQQLHRLNKVFTQLSPHSRWKYSRWGTFRGLEDEDFEMFACWTVNQMEKSHRLIGASCAGRGADAHWWSDVSLWSDQFVTGLI